MTVGGEAARRGVRARARAVTRPGPASGAGSVPRKRTVRKVLVACLVLAVVAAGAVAAGLVGPARPHGLHITAYFDRTVGVYAGSDLRILGVKAGRVDSVTPVGTKVEVALTLDHGVKVPAGAGAVVVAPSVVADRYIQLTPAYSGGPVLADHAVIPATRTATPVEIDQLYGSVTKLSDALGPNGANATGALSDLLDTGAANLKGNGKAIGDSISQLGKASTTLDDHSGDLFATLASLQSFTAMLKANDGKVKTATDQLSTVTGFLAADKQDLAGALQQLSTALGQVKTFIQDNRGRLKASVAKLAPITQTLVDQRASLAELLDTAPLAADNLLNAYDPGRGVFDGRTDINELSMGGGTAPAAAPGSRTAGSPGDAPPLPLPVVGTAVTTGTGGAR